jgi:SH3-like domain-containing protein
LFLNATAVFAEELPLPRFASLRSDTVYMRAGPGERFPIEWVYKRKGYPIQIIDSFELPMNRQIIIDIEAQSLPTVRVTTEFTSEKILKSLS